MKDKKKQERVLTFNLATEISSEEMEQVYGGLKGSATWQPSNHSTAGGHDRTYDYDAD